MSAAGRDRISAIIRALRQKTVANGCTEGEAVIAAAKLAQILKDYNMTVDEAELRASPFDRHQELHEDAVGERLWKPASAIGELTGAQFWTSSAGVFPVQVNFFGFAHEVDVARYLIEICARAMRTEARRQNAAYGLLVPAARRRKVNPFLDGMADRLRERILALKPPPVTGTGIIVLRGALIKAEMSLIGINLQDKRTRPSMDADSTYGDGRRAAERVALHRGLTGGPAAGQRVIR